MNSEDIMKEAEKLEKLTSLLNDFLQSISSEFNVKQMAYCLLESGSYVVYLHTMESEAQEGFIKGALLEGKKAAKSDALMAQGEKPPVKGGS